MFILKDIKKIINWTSWYFDSSNSSTHSFTVFLVVKLTTIIKISNTVNAQVNESNNIYEIPQLIIDVIMPKLLARDQYKPNNNGIVMIRMKLKALQSVVINPHVLLSIYKQSGNF